MRDKSRYSKASKARWAKIPKAERSRRMRKIVKARWNKKIIKKDNDKNTRKRTKKS